MFNVINCENYTEREIQEALAELVDFNEYISKGDRVLVKPNLYGARIPEKAITTHPLVVKEIVKKVQEIGATVLIADSPVGFYSERALKNIYRKTGMTEVSEETGCELNFNTSTYEAKGKSHPIQEYKIIAPVKEVDKLINVPEVKTHHYAKLTCATKNFYGVVPGFTKMRYHFRGRKMRFFSRMLIDLVELVKPTLTIADGVIGMEGAGPANGTPKRLNLMAAGTNTYEIDYVISKIIGLNPEKIPYLKMALERNLFEPNGTDFSNYYTKFEEAKDSRMFRLMFGSREY